MVVSIEARMSKLVKDWLRIKERTKRNRGMDCDRVWICKVNISMSRLFRLWTILLCLSKALLFSSLFFCHSTLEYAENSRFWRHTNPSLSIYYMLHNHHFSMITFSWRLYNKALDIFMNKNGFERNRSAEQIFIISFPWQIKEKSGSVQQTFTRQ